ncbi:MAG: WD40 repeat domain-containing protein, partial [Candidatus Melainabacteria bacterium HGW-Melainabacteria-1]
MAFSPDGRSLVSFQDVQIKFWSPDGRHLRKQLQMDAPVTDVRFTPDGRFFAVGTQFGHFTLWRSSDFTRLAGIHDLGNWQSFALSPDGVYLSICKLEPGA